MASKWRQGCQDVAQVEVMLAWDAGRRVAPQEKRVGISVPIILLFIREITDPKSY